MLFLKATLSLPILALKSKPGSHLRQKLLLVLKIFSQDNIDMALFAWLPENVIWGKPKIIDVLVVSGKSVAEA
ncbi:ComE operon protein 3 [Ligilactobacillus ruminis]|nr:ComE operon protein 3 [Ligilactobacillus ruminis]